jgi:hypothetical protein
VQSLSKTEVSYEDEKMIPETTVVTTDGKNRYRTLKDICKIHIEIVVKDKRK